mmetsp:Transcript_7510/g.22198  ORF Transcript_7510/g.22198 Transcript_7510/m.22198 type:complete len:313 (-) Transcript_7510:509-1447(-)
MSIAFEQLSSLQLFFACCWPLKAVPSMALYVLDVLVRRDEGGAAGEGGLLDGGRHHVGVATPTRRRCQLLRQLHHRHAAGKDLDGDEGGLQRSEHDAPNGVHLGQEQAVLLLQQLLHACHDAHVRGKLVVHRQLIHHHLLHTVSLDRFRQTGLGVLQAAVICKVCVPQVQQQLDLLGCHLGLSSDGEVVNALVCVQRDGLPILVSNFGHLAPEAAQVVWRPPHHRLPKDVRLFYQGFQALCSRVAGVSLHLQQTLRESDYVLCSELGHLLVRKFLQLCELDQDRIFIEGAHEVVPAQQLLCILVKPPEFRML